VEIPDVALQPRDHDQALERGRRLGGRVLCGGERPAIVLVNPVAEQTPPNANYKAVTSGNFVSEGRAHR